MRTLAFTDSAVMVALLVGLLILAGGVLLFVTKSMEENYVPLEIQLVVFGILILLFSTVAGKILSRD